MASTQQANHLTNRKRKATDMEQHQKNRPRQTSEMQSFPFLKFYDRLQQLPFSHPSQLLSSASGNNKNGLMAAGAQQEERGSRVDRPRRDGTVFDFARLRSHAFGSQNPTGDATDDDGSAVPRQYASSGTSNVPHNMFGEEDYFKDLGAFFNGTDEQTAHGHGPTNINPPSNATGDLSSILNANAASAASAADHGENRHLDSKESQQAPPRSTESNTSKQKATTSQPKKKKTSSQTLKSADGAAKEQDESELPVVGEEDRVMKNIREKKRRKGVSEKFKELYTLVCANTKKTADVGTVPSVKTGRVSKARMLDETINLIKNMECECSSLHARNRFLEYQLRQFQHMPQDSTTLAKAASIVNPPIMPFGTHTVNPFLYVKMASLPSGQLASRRQ